MFFIFPPVPDRFVEMRRIAAFFLLGGSTIPGLAIAECIDYEGYMHWVYRQDTPGSARALAVFDDLLYVADRTSGMQVIDISDPLAPTILGSVATPGEADGVDVSDGFAYVADLTHGLQIIDIGDPTSPQIVGGVDTPGQAQDVTVVGDLAFIADGTAGVQVIDVTNPQNPQIIGSVNTHGNARDVAASGGYVYVADSIVVPRSGTLVIIDASLPESPTVVASLDVSHTGDAFSVAISGDHAYVGTYSEGPHGEAFGHFYAIDISNPLFPQVLGGLYLGSAGHSITMSGKLAFVSTLGSLKVIDVSNLGNLQIALEPPVPFQAWESVLVGSHVFVAAGTKGIDVIDIDPPISSPILAGLQTYDAASLAVSGAYAYVGCRNGGPLYAIDLSNVESPQIVGNVYVAGEFLDLALSGNYIYVATGWDFRVIDVSDPKTPEVVGGVQYPAGTPQGVAISDGYAYAADDSGLQVIDVSDPSSPQLAGRVETPGEAFKVDVQGSHAYVAARQSGLQIVDIANPWAPVIVSSVATPNALGIMLSGTYAFVATYSGIEIIDVADPLAPVIVAAVQVPDSARDVAVLGTHAYVANWGSGVAVIDVSDPTSPDYVGAAMPENSAVVDVAVSSGLVFALNYSGLFQIIPAQCEFATSSPTSLSSPQQFMAFPNPASGPVTIRFHAPVKGPVRATIYDVGGRMVRSLHERDESSDLHELTWDGMDGNGRKAAAGVYWIRTQTKTGLANQRVTLIR